MKITYSGKQCLLPSGWRLWLAQHVSSDTGFLLLSFLTGLLAGTAAFLLKAMIGGVSELFTRWLDPVHANWAFLILPLAGVVLAALFQRKVMRYDISHGVDRLNCDLRTGKYRLRSSLMFSPMVASLFTLGFGGSAGSEGPIAYTGAAVGSNVGKICRISPRQLKALVICGAAAGIAGIFKAPIGGAFFALECLSFQRASITSIMGLMIASVASGLTAFVFSGCTPDIYFSDSEVFNVHWLPWVGLLGVFAGFYSIYYQIVMIRLASWYARRHNQWLKNLVAGVIIGTAVFLFPPLFGEGYGFISHMLGGNSGALTTYGLFAGEKGLSSLMILLLLGGMMLVKAFATASTTSGGGVAGDFAPSLFAGCIAGFFFAVLVNTCVDQSVFPGAQELPEGYFAFFGMAAVMAATQRAPLMAIFLTVEMGSAYTLFLPVVVAATISYFTLRFIGPMFSLRKPTTGTDACGRS